MDIWCRKAGPTILGGKMAKENNIFQIYFLRHCYLLLFETSKLYLQGSSYGCNCYPMARRKPKFVLNTIYVSLSPNWPTDKKCWKKCCVLSCSISNREQNIWKFQLSKSMITKYIWLVMNYFPQILQNDVGPVEEFTASMQQKSAVV